MAWLCLLHLHGAMRGQPLKSEPSVACLRTEKLGCCRHNTANLVRPWDADGLRHD